MAAAEHASTHLQKTPRPSPSCACAPVTPALPVATSRGGWGWWVRPLHGARSVPGTQRTTGLAGCSPPGQHAPTLRSLAASSAALDWPSCLQSGGAAGSVSKVVSPGRTGAARALQHAASPELELGVRCHVLGTHHAAVHKPAGAPLLLPAPSGGPCGPVRCCHAAASLPAAAGGLGASQSRQRLGRSTDRCGAR